MTPEREFVKLAATMLACRYQIVSGEWLGHPWPKPCLDHDLLGYRDYVTEMGLVVKEARSATRAVGAN